MSASLISFTKAQWEERLLKHASQFSPYADAFIKRRDQRTKHPVHDFLFTYYSFSPTKLKQWIPSYTQTLRMDQDLLKKYPWLESDWFHFKDSYLKLNLDKISKTLPSLLNFVLTLCENITQKPPRLGCFGLHEWVMVYQSSPDSIRHQGYPLRVSMNDLIEFVNSQKLCCTHYDAFRFFTKDASPLNMYRPDLERRLEMEQGGCVHANMDLYKWSTKLWPWIGSDLIGKAFFLAMEGRELDMRASPYDLTKDGYLPIYIETEEGRREYQQKQQCYAEKAQRLRLELLNFCRTFKRDLNIT